MGRWDVEELGRRVEKDTEQGAEVNCKGSQREIGIYGQEQGNRGTEERGEEEIGCRDEGRGH